MKANQSETLYNQVSTLEHESYTSSSNLTLAVGTPPVHHANRLGCPFGSRSVVLGSVLMDRQVYRAVQCDKWELRQVDTMDLIECLLASIGINCRFFLGVQGVELLVAVECDVESIRRNLATCCYRV